MAGTSVLDFQVAGAATLLAAAAAVPAPTSRPAVRPAAMSGGSGPVPGVGGASVQPRRGAEAAKRAPEVPPT
jgi:hypothetical protein